MLLLTETSSDNYRTLVHGRSVFEEALKWVPKGEFHFHVIGGPGGQYNQYAF